MVQGKTNEINISDKTECERRSVVFVEYFGHFFRFSQPQPLNFIPGDSEFVQIQDKFPQNAVIQ